MHHRLQSTVIQIFKLTLAACLIYWLIHSGRLDFNSLTQLLHWQFLIPCMACTGLSLFIASERWRKLLLAQNLIVPIASTFKITLIGTLFNFAMPGGVGGDVMRGFYMAKINQQSKTAAAISVFVDRLVGLYAMIILALVAMLFFSQTFEKPELKVTFVLLTVVFVVFTACWILLLSKRFHQKQWIKNPKFLNIYESFVVYQNHKNLFFQAFALSMVSQIVSFFFFIFAGHGLGYPDVAIGVYFFVVPLGFMLISIPISIAGIGVGQAAFLFLFNMVLSTKSQIGPAVITAYQVSLFLYGLVGSYFYLSFKKQV
jgi:uncharacterized membrane protein YbhN (UPF0104 family)